jgi:hypothetical protein
MKTFLTLFAALFCFQLQAAQFKYNELMLKDYDEMLHMVNAKLKQARAVGSNTSDENVNDQEAIEHLREAVKLILSRPDSDNMVAKLMPEVRKELSGYNAFEDVLSGLTAEEVAVAKDEKASVASRATALMVLENIIALVKPESVNNNDLRRLLDRIRSADIDLEDDVKHDFKLRAMFKTPNPSATAKKVLKSLPPLKKEEKKKAAAPKDAE